MNRRAGFILIAALWLIVALSAVGLDAALRTQASRAPAMNQLDLSRAREAALAGAAYAESRLTAALREREEELRAELRDNPREQMSGGRTSSNNRVSSMVSQSDPWRDPHELMAGAKTFGDTEFTLDVHDTGVALHLNEADEDMLRNFMSHGLRIDYATADRLTQAILDWRDQDEIPRMNGGEAEQYIRGGAAVLPANRPFADPGELRHVIGMTREIFEQMRPYVTVVGSGLINVNAAPEPVLLAVPTFTPPVVSELLRLRNAGQYSRDSGELREMLGRAYRPSSDQEEGDFTRRTTFRTNEVEVVSNGRVAGSTLHVVARTVLALSEGGSVVTWRTLE